MINNERIVQSREIFQISLIFNLLSYGNQSKLNYLQIYISRLVMLCFLASIVLVTIIKLSDQTLVWASPTNTRIGWLTFLNQPNTYHYTNASTPLNFQSIFSSPLGSTPTTFAPTIVGFKIHQSNDFSPQIGFDNFTTSSIDLILTVKGDTSLYYLQISYIAIGIQTYIQSTYKCFLCSVINSNNGTRNQMTYYQTTYSYDEPVAGIVMLSSFQLHNSNGINMNLASSLVIQPGNTTIGIKFTVDDNNTVDSICYVSLLYSQTKVEDQGYFAIVDLGKYELSLTVTPSTYTVSSEYQNIDRLFFGITNFNMSRGFSRSFGMTFQNLNNLNNGYFCSSSVYSATQSFYMIAIRDCDGTGEVYVPSTKQCQSTPNYCEDNGFETVSLTGLITTQYCSTCHYSCQQCNDYYDSNCTNCAGNRYVSGIYCKCNSGYIDIGVSDCVLCSTFIQGCNSCSSTTVCTTCSVGMHLTTNSQCACDTGYLVSGICINYKGCIQSLAYQGKIYCQICNATANFVLTTSYACRCKTGFTLVNQQCIFKCGDGILTSYQQCDDGNNIDGDGCSKLCQIQTNWTCSTENPSSCKKIASGLQIISIVRNVESNEMIMQVQLSPNYPQFDSLNFGDLINSSIPGTYDWSYDKGVLTMKYKYTQTLQGNDYYFNINLPSNYTKYAFYQTNVQLNGMNAQLTYDSSYEQIKPLSIIVYIFCAISLLIYFLGSFSQRMIGVQMIQTIQKTLFLLLLLKNCPSYFVPLQELRYSTGYNFFTNNDSTRTFTYYHRFSAIGIQKQFLLTYNLIYIFCLFSLLGTTVIGIIRFYYYNLISQQKISTQTIQIKEKIKPLKTGFNIVFERLFFLLLMMSMYTIVTGFFIQLTTMQAKYTILPQAINLISAIFANICIVGLIFVLAFSFFTRYKVIKFDIPIKSYVLCYTIYQVLLILSICICYGYSWNFYFIFAFIIAKIIYLLAIRPYEGIFHNVVLIFNQIVVIFTLLCYLLISMSKLQQSIVLVLCYVILILLIIVVILSTIRLILKRKFCLSAQNKQKTDKKQQNFQHFRGNKKNPVKIIEKQQQSLKYYALEQALTPNSFTRNKILNGQHPLLQYQSNYSKKNLQPEEQQQIPQNIFTSKQQNTKKPRKKPQLQIEIVDNINDYGSNNMENQLRAIKKKLRANLSRKINGLD